MRSALQKRHLIQWHLSKGHLFKLVHKYQASTCDTVSHVGCPTSWTNHALSTGNSGTTEQLVLAGGKRLAQVKNFALKQLSNPLEAAGFLHPEVIYVKIPFK